MKQIEVPISAFVERVERHRLPGHTAIRCSRLACRRFKEFADRHNLSPVKLIDLISEMLNCKGTSILIETGGNADSNEHTGAQT